MQPKIFSQFAAICLLFLVSHGGAAGLYRWVDEKGQVHYSDHIPPQQAKYGHSILDGVGIPQKHVKPQKSQAQLLQEERLAAERARAEHKRQARLAKDQSLLGTFSNASQIDRLREDRLTIIDSAVRMIRGKIAKIRLQLENAEQRKAGFLNNGRKLPAQLESNIHEYKKQLASYAWQVEHNLQRREETVARFTTDKARFLELREKERVRAIDKKQF